MLKAVLNGKIIDQTNALLNIADKGYFFDFSVYSSLKVVGGRLFFPEYHAERLLESAKVIGIRHNFNKDQIVSSLEQLVRLNKLDNSFVRMVLIGDPDGKEDEKLYIFVVGSLTFYPDKLYRQGAKAVTYFGERRVPTAKTKDLLLSFLAFKKANELDALDALLIDADGNVREGTRSNFFAIKGNHLFTPPADKVLGGITQKIVLEIAKVDFDIVRQDISLESIGNHDEYFITNTSMNVMPLSQINDTKLDTNFVKTRALQKLFKEYCHKNVLDT